MKIITKDDVHDEYNLKCRDYDSLISAMEDEIVELRNFVNSLKGVRGLDKPTATMGLTT